ncbi:MAG: hypoxanthine phosphoribosyltransferase [Deltaproteobacteria bacterium]
MPPSEKPSEQTPLDSLRVYLSRERISERVTELGREIERDHPSAPLVLIGVLKGSFIFLADLARAIARPMRVEFLGVQSYGNETKSSGAVQITLDVTTSVDGCDVIIVEDIVDTGLTAHFLMQQLAARRARSVRLCALLHKPAGARRETQIDYLGFTIEDVFVVGYGLDHAQQYRNLPDICVVGG